MKITAPAAAQMTGEILSHYGPVPVLFKDGVAEFEGELPPGIRAYLKANGYGLGEEEAAEPGGPVVQVDSREVGLQQVGTSLRDAAVDPRPGDFLAPVNAGDGDPHGPQVVSPGIHAEGERVVAAGPVFTDPEAQEANEKRLAEKLLVDGEPVVQPVANPDWLEQGGPLGLSDPGSAAAGEAAAKAGQDFTDAAVPPLDEPRGNASAAEWAAYARSQGATDEQIAGKSRDDLRAAYGS